MKTIEAIAQGLTAFSAIVLLSHLGIAYELFRTGAIAIYVLLLLVALIWGLILIARSLMAQSTSEDAVSSPIVAMLSSTPGIVALVVVIAGGAIGVITAI